MDIYEAIDQLIIYGTKNGLICEDDRIYTINRLLELFELKGYSPSAAEDKNLPINEILDVLLDYAVENNILENDTITNRDLFDTKIMGLLTPPPSVIRKEFAAHLASSPKEATDYYYAFSKATNYIRTDRIAKDEKWKTDTDFGQIDITINLSKPEKDPKDIALAAKAKEGTDGSLPGYPSCLLCVENEGYAGHITHPARQNHRIIPIKLKGEDYCLQYSPYVYYNEHCIIFNKKHTPMKIDQDAFEKLLDFVEIFPHYTAGSNADLPIVGGSILSHDHFQGGGYIFPMVNAPYENEFEIPGFSGVHAGIIHWPLSTIRLQAKDKNELANAAGHILKNWRSYTDEAAYIYAETDGTPHNTITPIARMRGDLFEIDLVLRNNITTDERPSGLYHPRAEYHHIKRENIGLIEVMGLAVLPARLKPEMSKLEEMILKGEDLRSDDMTKAHADWAEEFLKKYDDVNASNIHEIVQKEIGLTFAKVLEDAGVYKCTSEGREAFMRFVRSL